MLGSPSVMTTGTTDAKFITDQRKISIQEILEPLSSWGSPRANRPKVMKLGKSNLSLIVALFDERI
jgi:hypothetical protein